MSAPGAILLPNIFRIGRQFAGKIHPTRVRTTPKPVLSHEANLYPAPALCRHVHKRPPPISLLLRRTGHNHCSQLSRRRQRQHSRKRQRGQRSLHFRMAWTERQPRNGRRQSRRTGSRDLPAHRRRYPRLPGQPDDHPAGRDRHPGAGFELPGQSDLLPDLRSLREDRQLPGERQRQLRYAQRMENRQHRPEFGRCLPYRYHYPLLSGFRRLSKQRLHVQDHGHRVLPDRRLCPELPQPDQPGRQCRLRSSGRSRSVPPRQ